LVLGNGKLTVPRGVLIMSPTISMHRDTKQWDQPNDFTPERWLTPGTEFAESGQDGKSRVYKWTPFSDGWRDCVGQNFARLTYMAGLATLLGQFHFDLAPSMGTAQDVVDNSKMSFTWAPGDTGLWMQCKPRAA
jgi:cytochrome P450